MAEVEAYNAVVQGLYETARPKCEGCGRSFADAERLEKHSKGCDKLKAMQGGRKAGTPRSEALGGRREKEFYEVDGPRMLMCYLCGTKHGLASLGIHQRQCAEKLRKQR